MKKYEYLKLFKVLEEVIEREKKKELRDISRDVLFLQIGNARYHWPIKALEFYYKNNFTSVFINIDN